MNIRDKLVVVQVAKKNSFARVRNRCISTGLPRSVYEFFQICCRGLATTKPIEQGLAPQPVYKQGK